MLLFAEELIEQLLLFRVAWIRGRLGGGKTLLSVALAEHLLRLGLVDGVVANFPTVYPTALGPDDGTIYRRVLIYDEAWTQLDARDSLVNVRSYGAYARKFDSYWIFPSVHPIDKRLRTVVIWRTARVGLLNLWVYRWALDIDYDSAGGWFLLYNPSRFYPRYDNKYIPVDDGLIEKRWQRSLALATGGAGVEEAERLADYLRALQALGGIGEVVDVA